MVHPIQIRETATPNQEAHRILDHAVTEAKHLSEETGKGRQRAESGESRTTTKSQRKESAEHDERTIQNPQR